MKSSQEIMNEIERIDKVLHNLYKQNRIKQYGNLYQKCELLQAQKSARLYRTKKELEFLIRTFGEKFDKNEELDRILFKRISFLKQEIKILADKK